MWKIYILTEQVRLIYMKNRSVLSMCLQFFVASDPTVKNDRLWHEKYGLRKSMIPNFLSTDQARRVKISYKFSHWLINIFFGQRNIANNAILHRFKKINVY